MSAERYTTDITYPSAFGAFQAPIHLAKAAWSAGLASWPVDRPFAYLDLGCGGGLTLCVLADCYPDAEFHGVDLNPAHIAEARSLAEAAGLRNVVFHEASFADLANLPIPKIAYAGLSGVYSWLPPSLRSACLAYLNSRLTADGAVFLHYAALPGNAQIDALYALLREVANDTAGDSLSRYARACEVVGRLRTAGARFFKINPQADAWFAQLESHDPRSMAHEILNAQSVSLSARDAQDEAQAHGLRIVANAQLELNDLEISAPDGLQSDLAELGPVPRAMLMDAIRNTHSRMDVLMRRDCVQSTGSPDLWVDRLSRGPLMEERRAFSQRLGIDLFATAYNDILAATDGRAQRLRDLAADEASDRALQRLVALKLIQVARRPYIRGRAPGSRLLSRLNTLVLEDRIESSGPAPFSSPVAGSQVLLPPQDRLALMALLGGDFGKAWARMSEAGQRARLDGEVISDSVRLEAAARKRADALGAQMLEMLVALGIVG